MKVANATITKDLIHMVVVVSMIVHIAMQSLHDMKPIDSSLPVIYELDTIVYQQLTLTSDGKVVQHAD